MPYLETDLLQPFGEVSCEDELRILQDKYQKHYFDAVPFNSVSMNPKTYLIVGRRGTGKSSLAHYFTFQDQLEHACCIDVDEPETYKHVMARIAGSASGVREIAIPRIVRVWEYAIWALIFRQLADEDRVIAAACAFRDSGSAANLILRVLKQLVSKHTADQTGELADDMEAYLSSEVIRKGKLAVAAICKRRPLIVAIDSLEHYAINDDATMWAAAALVECASKFNRDFARQGIHVKVFLNAEVYPRLTESVISNTLKYVRDPLFLQWRPRDLIRLICWRFSRYLRAHDQAEFKNGIDWEDFESVCGRLWNPFFGATLTNRYGRSEPTFAYVLRHTQLRPRQLVVLCNKVAEAAQARGTFPKIDHDVMRDTVRAEAPALATEVINAYSSSYVNLARIVDALSGLPISFDARHLDKVAPRTAGEWPNHEYSPSRFRNLVAELGIVGRVRSRDDHTRIIQADFEYALHQPLSLQPGDECVIHPMFFQRFRIDLARGYTVFPFPDRAEFVDVQS
jgi:hypothetical protein